MEKIYALLCARYNMCLGTTYQFLREQGMKAADAYGVMKKQFECLGFYRGGILCTHFRQAYRSDIWKNLTPESFKTYESYMAATGKRIF